MMQEYQCGKEFQRTSLWSGKGDESRTALSLIMDNVNGDRCDHDVVDGLPPGYISQSGI